MAGAAGESRWEIVASPPCERRRETMAGAAGESRLEIVAGAPGEPGASAQAGRELRFVGGRQLQIELGRGRRASA